jgi:hypothetical protein
MISLTYSVRYYGATVHTSKPSCGLSAEPPHHWQSTGVPVHAIVVEALIFSEVDAIIFRRDGVRDAL